MILSNDASFEGWAIVLATEDGPRLTRHVSVNGGAHRWDRYLRAVEEDLEPMLGEAALLGADRGEQPRLVVERCPPVLGGGVKPGRVPAFAPLPEKGDSGNGPGARNATLSAFGLGMMVGPLMLLGVRPGWDYPEDVEPGTWRRWWGITGKGRVAKKRAARDLVRRLGWGKHLEPYPERGEDLGPLGDVAEGILLGVGVARALREGRLKVDGPKRPPVRSLLVARDSRTG